MEDKKNNNGNSNTQHDDLESQPLREGIRRNLCTSRLRHSRTCTCGRPQALTRRRKHHHWLRLSACSHCLRADAARSNADANHSQTAVDHV